MSKLKIPESAFKDKILDRAYHDRLILDLDQIVATAGIPAAAVWAKLSSYCIPDEVEWVRQIRSKNDSGLIFIGEDFNVLVADKMAVIAGVCLRNYTDARVMPVQDVVRLLKSDSMPSPTVLLIPNFCLDKANGGDVPSWEISNLMGLLLNRMNSGKKTILHCSSMAIVQKQYGDSFKALLEGKYSKAMPSGVAAPMAFAQTTEQE
jgi:hypothetical protein